MREPILFYFEFSSPYGYLASEKIDALAAKHNRDVIWKPFLLGPIFKETGSQPLLGIPLKGAYAVHDIKRSARLLAVPFQLPDPFPFLSVHAARLSYWAMEKYPELAHDLMQRLYRAAFAEGRDISDQQNVVEIAASLGLPQDAVIKALHDPLVKERLRREMDEARRAQVFGSPYFIVDGEPFWGHDRLEAIDLWLERGGW